MWNEGWSNKIEIKIILPWPDLGPWEEGRIDWEGAWILAIKDKSRKIEYDYFSKRRDWIVEKITRRIDPKIDSTDREENKRNENNSRGSIKKTKI